MKRKCAEPSKTESAIARKVPRADQTLIYQYSGSRLSRITPLHSISWVAHTWHSLSCGVPPASAYIAKCAMYAPPTGFPVRPWETGNSPQLADNEKVLSHATGLAGSLNGNPGTWKGLSKSCDPTPDHFDLSSALFSSAPEVARSVRPNCSSRSQTRRCKLPSG